MRKPGRAWALQNFKRAFFLSFSRAETSKNRALEFSRLGIGWRLFLELADLKPNPDPKPSPTLNIAKWGAEGGGTPSFCNMFCNIGVCSREHLAGGGCCGYAAVGTGGSGQLAEQSGGLQRLREISGIWGHGPRQSMAPGGQRTHQSLVAPQARSEGSNSIPRKKHDHAGGSDVLTGMVCHGGVGVTIYIYIYK